MRKWSLFLCTGLVIIALMAAGCGKKEEAKASDDPVEQKITYNVAAEPETLDPAASTGAPEGTIQLALFEGLTRLDANNQPIPGIAQTWDVSADGLQYTFHLRDAKWSNGDPVTAQDFEYAWKRLLNPDLANYYAFQAYYIVNGEEYNSGKATAADVGVKALDDKTLQVSLTAPTPYFLGLTAFTALYPVNQKVDQATKDWFTKPETFVGNGPFKLTEWEHNQKLVLVKNENYWAADDVKLQTLVMTTVESDTTELTMFETDQLDVAENPPQQELKRLLEEKTAQIFPDLGVYFYVFNTDKKPLDDSRVRRAMSLAIDRQSLIDNVTQAFEKPALAIVPYGVSDDSGDFRKNGGDYFKEDIAEAKKLLAEAGFPDGKDFPTLKLLFNTKESHQKIAETLQEMWKVNLGINVELTNQEFGVYENSVKVGDFDIARAGWLPDYSDPMTYLDLWMTSDLSMYYTGWSNPQYDKLIKTARIEADPAARFQEMHDAEKILMADMPVLPIYFYTNPNMYKPWVKGVIVPTLGAYQEFRWAYVEK